MAVGKIGVEVFVCSWRSRCGLRRMSSPMGIWRMCFFLVSLRPLQHLAGVWWTGEGSAKWGQAPGIETLILRTTERKRVGSPDRYS